MKKKLLVMFAALLTVTFVNAQVMRTEELEKYAKEKYGDKWTEAAENLSSQLALDKNNSLTYEQIIDCGESTKEQLYVTLNYWFTATFGSVRKPGCTPSYNPIKIIFLCHETMASITNRIS